MLTLLAKGIIPLANVYSYDNLDRMTEKCYNNSSNQKTAYYYGNNGYLSATVDYSTNTYTKYMYDLAGRIAKQITYSGTDLKGNNRLSSVEYEYNAATGKIDGVHYKTAVTEKQGIKMEIQKNEIQNMLKNSEKFFEQTKPFEELIMRSKCAMLEVKTKLDVLNTQLSLENDRNPFESISCRIKSVPSIIEKLDRKGLALTAKNMEENLNDIAGIRVICSFIDDIYTLSDRLCSQDDIRLVEKKDYIKNPKPNGYRSLHLIVEIPIFLMDEKKYMRVEVQFRTIAMDFWASLEHKLKYKKDIKADVEEISKELKICSDEINRLDIKMQDIHRKLESH